MKIILRHDERDCGASCLAMVAEHYGYVDSGKKFREMTSTDQDGTSLHEMIRAADSIGLSSEVLFGNPEDLTQGIEDKEDLKYLYA